MSRPPPRGHAVARTVEARRTTMARARAVAVPRLSSPLSRRGHGLCVGGGVDVAVAAQGVVVPS